MKRTVRLTRAVFVTAITALIASVLTVSSANAATTIVTVPSGQAVKFMNSIDIGASATPGFTARYANVCPSCSTAIDGIVTAVSTDGGRIVTLDYTRSNFNDTAPINTNLSSPSSGGSITYQVAFVLTGTEEPVTMQDVYVNVTDIDSRQWAQFSGVQEYAVSSSPGSKLSVQTNSTNAAIPVGAYRFAETNGLPSTDADQDFWAQVKYSQASSILVTLAKGPGSAGTAVFGVSFNAAQWSAQPTIVTPQPSSYVLSYDSNGATGGSTPAAQTGGQTYTVASNSGPLTRPGYAFNGWNTLTDGNGVAYNPPGTTNDSITLTADTVLYAQWLPNFPQLQVTKYQTSVDPTYPAASPADEVTYAVSVFNTGNVALTNVNITDAGAVFVSGVGCTSLPIATLSVGQQLVCTFKKTATSTADITNVAQVSSDQIANVTSNTVTTKVNGTNDLQIAKQQISATPTEAGETINFALIVLNAGSLAQTAVNVSDANAVLGSCSPALSNATLQPGDSSTCLVSHVVTQDEIDAGVYINTAQVTSAYFGGGGAGSAVNSNTITVPFLQYAALDLQKAQSTADPVSLGDAIGYNILVTNIGNVDLTNLTVTDPGADSGTINCGVTMPTTLAPQAQLSCVAIHTTVDVDFAAGVFTNTAFASSDRTAEQASNTVTTVLPRLAATGVSEGQLGAISLLAVIASLSGVLLLVFRRRRV